jgi:hypothetical protein
VTHGNELDRFLPHPDVRERHETLVKAPAPLVFDVAMHFDMQSLLPVRAIFWLRERLLRATPGRRTPQGIVAETIGLGWGILSHRQGRTLVMGAVTQPWKADVAFRRIPAEQFAEFDEPNMVKICWTLEADRLGGALTRFSSETRAAATDDESRRRFRRYWRWAGFGIVAIRWLLLPAIRRAAERRFREESGYILRRVLG